MSRNKRGKCAPEEHKREERHPPFTADEGPNGFDRLGFRETRNGRLPGPFSFFFRAFGNTLKKYFLNVK